MSSVPCRLFVVMAHNAEVAAIIRRGPSKWYQIIKWNTRRDIFTDGAWFKGRIYEEKCDLSPDGQLFLYSCHKAARLGTSYTSSWTALSRLPWLHALALWPFDSTYGGGGRFIADREVRLRNGRVPTVHPDHPARGLVITAGSAELHKTSAEVEGAEWSGRDQAGRLVFTQGGKLFRFDGNAPVEVADFNDREPTPEVAPPWAQHPLT